jgi:glucose dehydrogenase
VTYWRDPGGAESAACAERIYLPIADARLIALDAANGQVCPGFGEGGSLHLEAGMPYNPAGYCYSTSPPVAVAGKIIIGGAMNDNFSIYEPSGVIRAFDVDTGALIWNWDSGNPESTAPIDIAGGETYTTKQGDIWVLNRETGEPIQTVTEVPAPGGAIEGDSTAPKQPTTQLTFNPPPLEERNMWGVTLFDQALCRIRFHQLRYEGRYTPPSL